MSENSANNPQNEEVDLGQLFNAIGRLFSNLFNFIASIFKGLFKLLIYALKPLINNFKIISIILLALAVIGFVADKFRKDIYTSDMLVKPYFDSKYQLANNVDYFNALIKSSNYSELSRIFEIDTSEAKELIEFEMEIGPETKNDLLIDYNEYLSEIDSTLADDVSFDDFIANRDILAASIFSIKAKAHQIDIFKSLEKGFINTFENEYSKKLKEIRDDKLDKNKEIYLGQLEKIDSLQTAYFKIKVSESQNQSANISSTLFPMIQDKSQTREFELFQEELKIRERIRLIEEQKIEENDYYDILSGFEEVGKQQLQLSEKYFVVLPSLALILMAISFLLYNVFNYIKDYEE
ncbi:MAG: hypothetical protein Wins2KO_21730 [Winogradskyella sp.]